MIKSGKHIRESFWAEGPLQGLYRQRILKVFFVMIGLLFSMALVYKLQMLGSIAVLGLPIAACGGYLLFKYPGAAVWASLIMAFLTSGIARYVSAPWGLSLDILLAAAWIALIMNPNTQWKRLDNELFYASAIWFLYIMFEIINPFGNGLEAWFYAMRGIGFYQVLSVGITLLLFRERKHLILFWKILFIASVLGAFWGLKQFNGVLDYAENHWLFAEEHHEEHILHGVLRVFSFYSDAGQFGASQAMMVLVCVILVLSPVPVITKVWYSGFGLLFLIGFAISGTRGALAVPFCGAITYLIIKKNFALLLTGVAAIGIVFFILKYTFMFQSVEQVRRMRSALDPNNRSLEVRLENQVTFGRYLANKPFGGGVGTAGYWGARFNPESLMANTATDSWYVKIWAETGVVGICLHLGLLGFLMGRGAYRISQIGDPVLKDQIISLYAAISGVLFSSYGNQVFGQMPTGMIMNVALHFVFIAYTFEPSDQLKPSDHENNH
ncbi:O-antigen ligase family protein [Reichenbachiella versicolor]|uniref:O-antigen ligase family protein n=1 Tax=Reichenbachiella versicolor TaxID=1821036 RepID=UPI000D6E5E4A|nr:O-antigen ligase family protein [Reichenbachiella versicolor]